MQVGLLSMLLLLATLCMIIAAVNAVQSVHAFQQQYINAKAGNIASLRPWMTVPIVARVYHVPEEELCMALQIEKTDPLRRATLYEIASHKRKPVDQVVHTLQSAILNYRHQHPSRAFLEEWIGRPPTVSATSVL
jgi:hypothetical protein